MKKKRHILDFIFIITLIFFNTNVVSAKTRDVNRSYSITKGASRTPTIYEKNGVMEFAPSFSCDLGSASEYFEIKGLQTSNKNFGNILVKKVPSEKKTFSFTCKSSTRSFIVGWGNVNYNVTIDLYPDATIDKEASTYTGSNNGNDNQGNNNSDTNDPGLNDSDGTADDKCSGIFGNVNDKTSLAYMLHKTLNFMQFLGPILVIVLSIMDLVRAVTSSDKDILTKFLKKTGLRLIYAVLLFVFPPILNWLFELINVYGTCGI